MFKKQAIGIDAAANRFYNMRKQMFDDLGWSKQRAITTMKNLPNVPANRFNSISKSTKFFDSGINNIVYPERQRLKEAKKSAFENTPGIFKRPQALNKRIDENGFINKSTFLGTTNGQDKMLNGYYDIKNQTGNEYVLANVSTQIGVNTWVDSWEFVDKSLI